MEPERHPEEIVVEDPSSAAVRVWKRVPLQSVVRVGNHVRDRLRIHHRRVTDPSSEVKAQRPELRPHMSSLIRLRASRRLKAWERFHRRRCRPLLAFGLSSIHYVGYF